MHNIRKREYGAPITEVVLIRLSYSIVVGFGLLLIFADKDTVTAPRRQEIVVFT